MDSTSYILMDSMLMDDEWDKGIDLHNLLMVSDG